jgi:deoxycytidylate deaminase
MTHAYCESLKSSCLKRKVGAIISTNESEIIASGYNLAPRAKEKGAERDFSRGPWHEQESCKEDWGMCYRDKEKINLLKKIERCPHCGRELIKAINCPKCSRTIEINDLYPKCPQCHLDLDIDNYFICKDCGKKIVKEFIGKLMEKCRALHAEEIAIIQLSKLGSGIPLKDIKATLYTTTYPCFQCANKIVQSIIKKVVYVEPYPQKESEELFTKFEKEGKINLEKFEGVKARALFRIFDRNEWGIINTAP